MYVITDKNKHTLIAVGEILDYIPENGYPTLVNERIAFVPDAIIIYEGVDNIPEDYTSGKYCYTTEKGFYLNPEWIEPDITNVYGVSDELYHQIKDAAVEQIQQEVNANVNQ